MKGEISMEIAQKVGLGLVCVNLAVIIAIIAMYPIAFVLMIALIIKELNS